MKLQPNVKLTEHLQRRIASAIRDRYSARHVPRFIFAIGDIPYTVNGKKCEVAVKNVVNRRKGTLSGTVANPDALTLYTEYADLPPEKHRERSKEAKL